ncbi:division/cell wall cluster transcriptional repressor MraZ [bacterium]|nr:division/cell wall cluster transcriptional repressor MraZ [bacterium]
MALFLSAFTNKIDKKGRVSVPASFRQALVQEIFQGIVAYPSFIHPCVEACSMRRMERLSESIDSLDPYDDARDAFAASILGAATSIPFDGEGRIMLPESLIHAAGIKDEVTFLGKGQLFEIWEPKTCAAHTAKARELAMRERGRLHLAPKDGGQA